jgi:formamidopyrimidine-DNA glycosylase
VSAQPEPERFDDTGKICQECGRPIEEDLRAGKPFVVCRSCYDAPVDNAGR